MELNIQGGGMGVGVGQEWDCGGVGKNVFFFISVDEGWSKMGAVWVAGRGEEKGQKEGNSC